MKAVAIAIVAAAAISPSAAFAPSNGARATTSLAATFDRRDAIGNIAKLMGGVIVAAGAGAQGMRANDNESYGELMAGAQNPALGGWRHKSKGGGDGSYKPGKGMRAHESYDDVV
eukprot:CAMPEP_0172327700 /NCGR_PEP_ID=MMETSP1058-20130122/59969_1 /TAXON_ID=83371 /ORGANISM="Detonula confervacea, Strain CCMP 353" /LENGTH=114 /DNA_ID=CAMNT_0013044783 /DNA_START=28 /DNA_END=372 /DNA_ORIENTATION=+